MESFSQRYNLAPIKEIQINDIDIVLFNRLWNIFYNEECSFDILDTFCEPGVIEYLLDNFGLTYQYPNSAPEKNYNVEKLKRFLDDSEWYIIYDWLEKYIKYFESDSDRNHLQTKINKVLIEEKAGYRMIEGLITPITSELELSSLSKSMSTKFEPVNTHLKKALELYSKRENPDYENSIKESISAVEAICCIITGTNGVQATLGKALKKLKDAGVYIHPAMESAFSTLYGYTSDENGIRHGATDSSNVEPEDAKFMLVSCSAFVNYLIEKLAK